MDRSAAYAARYAAKNVVAAGLAKQAARSQLAYAIGVAHPVSVLVETFGTGTVCRRRAGARRCRRCLTCARPPSSATWTCARPIYRQLAAYGHMGREDLGVKWENTDRVDALKAAVAE